MNTSTLPFILLLWIVKVTENSCSSASIPLLNTGSITFSSSFFTSQTENYYQDLSSSQFTNKDILGYAFAISGFSANCGQATYSFQVSSVYFQNQNTRMMISLSFANLQMTASTIWLSVSMTYLIVSSSLNGGYSDIWATVASIPVNEGINNAPIDMIGSSFTEGPGSFGDCEMVIGSSMMVDLTNCNRNEAASNQQSGGVPIIHAYIMGFKWNPSKSKTYLLAASVLNPGSSTSDSNGWVISYSYKVPSGPKVTISSYNQALEWIQVGFVYTRFDGGDPYYPQESTLLYTSSHIYDNSVKINVAVPIANQAPNNNPHYYLLPSIKYAIYGFSSFSLQISGSCTHIFLNGTLSSPSIYTVASPYSYLPNAIFVADIYIKNIDQMCQSSKATEITTIIDQIYSTIPTDQNQSIQEALGQIPTNTGITVSPNALILQYTALYSPVYATVFYRAQIQYQGINVGSPLRIDFCFYEIASTMIPGAHYTIELTLNGYVIIQQVYTAQNSNPSYQNTLWISKGINTQSSVANIVISISFLRIFEGSSANQVVYTSLSIYQYNQAYDPTTGCCDSYCPAGTGLDVSSGQPTCVYCNTFSGLIYSPSLGTCQCSNYLYSDISNPFQCYPCTTFCSQCNLPASPASCFICVSSTMVTPSSQICACSPYQVVQNICLCSSYQIPTFWGCFSCIGLGNGTGLVNLTNSSSCGCNTNFVFVWSSYNNTGSCECINNYSYNSTTNTCQCSAPSYLSSGKCICGTSTSIYVPSLSSCISCSTIPFSTHLVNGSNACGCNLPFVWIAKQGLCDCNSTAINIVKNKSNTCLNCPNVAFSTSKMNSTACNCISGLVWIPSNYTCTCPSTSVFTKTVSCITCASKLTIDLFTCSCQAGYIWYDLLPGMKCVACSTIAKTTGKVNNYMCKCQTNYQWDVLTYKCIATCQLANKLNCFVCSYIPLASGTNAILMASSRVYNHAGGTSVASAYGAAPSNYASLAQYMCNCVVGTLWDSYRKRCFSVQLSPLT